MKEKFRGSYFVRSVGSKTFDSNYVDYRTKKFSNLANDIIEVLELESKKSGESEKYKECKKDDSILDFGCATGALLKELKDRGFKNVKGTDISNWAIEYGKETYELNNELEFYNRNLLCETFDHIIMLDVIEHLPDYELETVFKLAHKGLKKKLLIRVPTSCREGEDFVLDVSKNDRTHIQIHSKDWWISKIESFGFVYLTDVSRDNIFSSPGVFCGMFKNKTENNI